MDVSSGLAERLKEAEEALDELPDGEVKSERLRWLERQLANVVAQLQAIMADIDSGLSISDLGFFGDEEFEEILDDMGAQIANLRCMIQQAKELGGRG